MHFHWPYGKQTTFPSRDQHNTWVIGRVLGEKAPVTLLYTCPDGNDIAEVNYTFSCFAMVKTTYKVQACVLRQINIMQFANSQTLALAADIPTTWAGP